MKLTLYKGASLPDPNELFNSGLEGNKWRTIGIGVPDLVAAKQYYDELMSILGLKEWLETRPWRIVQLRA